MPTLTINIEVPDLASDIHEADFAEKVAERVRNVAEMVAVDVVGGGGVTPLSRYQQDRGRIRGEQDEPFIIANWRYQP